MNNKMTELVDNDQFAKYVGLEILKVEIGYALTKMEVKEHHFNGVGFVQGGAIFTLADFAFAAASNSKGLSTVGINANITYFKTPKGKFITAEAKELSATRKLSHYSVDIFDENGELIARFNATGYIKSEH